VRCDLTNASLNQDSNEKNANARGLQVMNYATAGTARGANRIITYISLKTGLLVRATEEASQKMNVTVARPMVSNRIHYDVNAKSHSEVVLVVQTAWNPKTLSNRGLRRTFPAFSSCFSRARSSPSDSCILGL